MKLIDTLIFLFVNFVTYCFLVFKINKSDIKSSVMTSLKIIFAHKLGTLDKNSDSDVSISDSDVKRVTKEIPQKDSSLCIFFFWNLKYLQFCI